MPRTLHAGDRGPDVEAMQRGLRRALGAKARNNGRGAYGTNTIRDVQAFKRGWTKQDDGHLFGATAWGHLERFLQAADRKLLAQAKTLELQRALEGREAERRRLVVAEARWALANRGPFVYTNVRPFVPDLHNPDSHRRTDCSAFATGCFHGAGAPDPNGLAYRGWPGAGCYGFTGTLWSHGEATAPEPAGLAFYGDMGAGFGHAPSHVAVIVDDGMVVSFGHTPISIYPIRYRTDYRGSRRYPVL
jgi:hypothetical protein